MPFALIVVGILLFVTAINNTWKVGPNGGNGLFPQLYADMFSEDGGFVYWAAGIVIIGLIGYVPAFKKPADTFIILIIFAMIIKNGGFFQQLQAGLQAGPSGTSSTASTSTTAAGATTANTGLFSGALGSILLNQQATLGTTPLTTPAPAPAGQSVPLGFGGIGSA